MARDWHILAEAHMSKLASVLKTLGRVVNVVGGLTSVYFSLIRPWHLKWGATADEATRDLPGDDLVREPLVVTTRAITIRASAAGVWAWLVQMGQGRGGFYSYDWLENLASLDIHNADRIVPEWQQLQAGEVVRFWKDAGVKVMAVEPNRHLVLAGEFHANENVGATRDTGGSWVFVLEEIDAHTTRLIVRARVAHFPPVWMSRLFAWLLLEPSHFVMERRMLLGIKQRAESNRNGGPT
jgi:hypothetical protein